MKLDAKLLRYMSKDDFRVLTAVELGSKNHDIVPIELICSIAGLRYGGVRKMINTLLRNKLVRHDGKKYDGYRLTYAGYDYLALRTLLLRGTISAVGRQIGIGKEADVYSVQNSKGEVLALKLHRLGRTSFRKVKEKRDYHQHRKNASWLYLSRLAATKEYAFMKALHETGFPTPTPIDHNRHAVLMTMADGYPMCQINDLGALEPAPIYNRLMQIILRLARYGLIHCDFNEFNLLLSNAGLITMIDFPQMISTSHRQAQFYFERDVNSIRKYFGSKFSFVSSYPKWSDVIRSMEKTKTKAAASNDIQNETNKNNQNNEEEDLNDIDSGNLDKLVEASGFSKRDQLDMDRLTLQQELDLARENKILENGVQEGFGAGNGYEQSDEENQEILYSEQNSFQVEDSGAKTRKLYDAKVAARAEEFTSQKNLMGEASLQSRVQNYDKENIGSVNNSIVSNTAMSTQHLKAGLGKTLEENQMEKLSTGMGNIDMAQLPPELQNPSTESVMNKVNKNQRQCFNCGEYGHISRKCPNGRAEGEEKDKARARWRAANPDAAKGPSENSKIRAKLKKQREKRDAARQGTRKSTRNRNKQREKKQNMKIAKDRFSGW